MCVLPGYVSPVPLSLLQGASRSSVLGAVAAAPSHPHRGGLLGLRRLRRKGWKKESDDMLPLKQSTCGVYTLCNLRLLQLRCEAQPPQHDYATSSYSQIHNRTGKSPRIFPFISKHAHVIHMQILPQELYLYLHTNAAVLQSVTILLLITRANSGMTNTAHTSLQ